MASAPAAALMRLTIRDRALIQVLHELRYLTVHQIRQVCYWSISTRAASRRLSLLARRGLLDCLGHRAFDDRRAFWCLTSLGRSVAAALTEDVPDRARVCALAALQMEHLIATNQLFCNLCLEHRAGRLRAFRWFASHHAAVDLGETRLVPDAVILAPTPDGHWWMYCVEVDRHTMAADALGAKFARYRLMHQLADLRRDQPLWEARAASWLVFACEDVRRAADAARLAAESGVERVWAGTAAELPSSLAASLGRGAFPTPAGFLPLLPGGIVPPVEGGSVVERGEGAR